MTLNIDNLINRIAAPDAPIRKADKPQDGAKPVTFIFSGGQRDAETLDAAKDLLQWYMDKHAHCLTRVKLRHVGGADVHNNGARFIGNPGPTVRKAAHRAFSYVLSELGTVRFAPAPMITGPRPHVAGSNLPIPGATGNGLDGSKITPQVLLPKF